MCFYHFIMAQILSDITAIQEMIKFEWYESSKTIHVDGILPRGPYSHAYAWQMGPFWQDTLDVWCTLWASSPDQPAFRASFSLFGTNWLQINRLVQERRNSSALAMELRLSCTNPSKCAYCWFLTHWGRVTHICVSKLTIIGSDNGLPPDWRQAIIWTNAGLLLIQTLRTNFSEILIRIHTFSNKKMHLKMSSGKCWLFCLGLKVLIHKEITPNLYIFNYANPVYGVATICHQVCWLRWGHPSLFHTATYHFIWYKMFCVRDISHRLTWIEFISMFSMYAKSGMHSRFNW